MTVTPIDARYLGVEESVSTYLVRQSDRAAFIETATVHAVPTMLKALRAHGLHPRDVDYIVISHVHLDHAGGAAKLMQACPNATLLAHPKAAPHAIDPRGLVESAAEVYGRENLQKMYGSLDPIPSARVRTLDDNETLDWNGRVLRFLHTRGHANHHFCIHDPQTRSVFTGDAFGLVYPALQQRGLFAIPSTSPTDFDAEAAAASLERIVGTGSETAYLTHFGGVSDLPAVAAQLRDQLDHYGEIVDDAYASGAEGPALDARCEQRVRALFDALLTRHGLETPRSRAILEMDMKLNSQGIAFAVKKRRYKANRATSRPANPSTR